MERDKFDQPKLLLDNQIKQFFQSAAFAVIGASNDRSKYGNKVVRCYLQHNKIVYPIHPSESLIEQLPCINKVENIPSIVTSISIVTPPTVTAKIVTQARSKGIKNMWMQPGAEDPAAVLYCKNNGINLIYGGPCILVVMEFHDVA